MPRITLVVNGSPHEVDVRPDAPLLFVLRDRSRLTGTKYGCGEAQCGACTVLVGDRRDQVVRDPAGSCKEPITTIEGLERTGSCTPSSRPSSTQRPSSAATARPE